MYISKMTRNESRAIDRMQQIAFDKNKPKDIPQNPIYRDMQNIIDKAKRGEKL